MATSSSTSQSDTIMAKPSAKSIVWEYFGVEKGSNGRLTNLGHGLYLQYLHMNSFKGNFSPMSPFIGWILKRTC